MAVDAIKPTEKPTIRGYYTPGETEHDWLKKVYQRFADMKQYRSKFEPLWDKWWRQYEAWRPPKVNWQSNIVPPYTTSVVEAIISELVDQTLRPIATGRGPEDKAKATVMNHTVDYTWEIGDGDIEDYKAIKEAIVIGQSFVQEYYWRDARQVRTLVRYDPVKGVEIYEDKEVTDYDDVYGESVSCYDLWFDENARSINRGPYKANDAIRRYIIDIDRFREIYKGPIWDPLGNAKYVKAGGDTSYYEYYKPPQGIAGTQVEVVWYWSRVPDRLVIVANDVVVREGPNPYNHKQLPFAQAIDIMKPHQLYHKGEPELLESIQDELTTIRRQRIDRVHLDIDKVFLISNRETLGDQDLIPTPHKGIYVEDPNTSIKPLDYNQTPQSAYLEEDRMKDDGATVTGIDLRSQALSQSGSATSAAIIKESTLKRLRMKVWLLTRTLYTEQMRLRVANITQFYQEPKLRRILGSEDAEIVNAYSAGNIQNMNGQKYLKEPRMIRTTNTELVRQPSGAIDEQAKRGENFFEVLPEDVIPSKGSFDLKISAEPTFPVSKPMQQQKVNELFAHPVMVAAFQTHLLDLKKGADKMLEVNDFDPRDFEPAAQGQSALDPQKVIELAFTENKDMAQGAPIPGTGFAPREHTDIHTNFMGSPDFQQAVRANPEVLNIFIRHVSLEEEAQKNRPGTAAPEMAAQSPGGGSAAAGVAASPAAAANAPREVGPTATTEGIAPPIK